MKKTLQASAVALAILGSSTLIMPAQADGDKEKCYGVVKAGKNDCATKSSSCVGSSKSDSQSDAFVVMPKGLCAKLTGGSLSSS